MLAQLRGAKYGTLKQMVNTDDTGFGFDTTWQAIGALRMRVTTAASNIRLAYEREGFNNVMTMQALNFLPRRILGYKTLRELLLGIQPLEERMRIDYEGRTMSIVGVRFPNEGQIHGRNSIINIDCVETPQMVGILDKA